MKWRTWQAATAVLAAAALIYFVKPQDTDMAHMAANAGAWHDAVGSWERVARAHPDDADAHRQLRLAYARDGKTERALAMFEADARQGSLDRAGRKGFLELALAHGQAAKAVRLLAVRPEALAPEELPALVKAALMAQDLKTARRLQSALLVRGKTSTAALEQARDLAVADRAPGEAALVQRRVFEAHRGTLERDRLVSLELQAKRPDAALAALEAFRAPNEGAGWDLRGAQLARWAGRPEAELSHLRGAFAADHDLATGKALLDRLEARRNPAAAEVARTLAELAPHDPALAARRDALLLAGGRSVEVLAERRAEVGRAPNDAGAHAALVSFALAQLRRDVAIEELARWTAAHPNDHLARHQLAVVYGWDRRPAEACHTYEQLLAWLPAAGAARPAGAPDLATEIHWRAEWAALATFDQDTTHAGRNNLRRVLSYEPWHVDWRRRLATAMHAAGEVREAVEQQRLVLHDPHASTRDILQLASWSLELGDRGEARRAIAQLDARSVLTDDLLWRAYDVTARLDQWADAGRYLQRLADRSPLRRDYWVALATAREHTGEVDRAARAWRRALALGPAEPGEHLRVATLYRREGRGPEALAFLQALGPAATPDELHLRATLAHDLHRATAELRAWQAYLAVKPSDALARMALADGLAARGDAEGARAQEARALAIAPGDVGVMGRVAARRFYAGQLAAARPLLEQLAGLPGLAPETLRLLADYDGPARPARAARWLDAYHEAAPGDANSWFARGEAARAIGDAATAQDSYERAIAIAETDPSPDTGADALAAAADRLGRTEKAVTAWNGIVARHPDRLPVWVALARHHLAAHERVPADRCIARAHALAPAALETRMLEADALADRGQPAAALPILSALRAEHPDQVAIASAEARVHEALGQMRAARQVAREVLARSPADAAARDAYRYYRDAGAGRVGVQATHEGTALLQKNTVNLIGRQVLSDALQLQVGLARLDWGETTPAVQEGSLGLTLVHAALHLLGDLAFDTRAVGAQRPYGGFSAAWQASTWRADAGVAERRWEDAAATVASGGRERAASLGLAWQPEAHVALSGHAEVGELATAERVLGPSNQLRAEALFRPEPEGPWQLVYQFRHRAWGDAAAPLGLPPSSDVHDLWLGYRRRWGDWSAQVSPGYSLAARLDAGTPMVAAAIAWEPSPDLAISLDGGWSAQSLEIAQQAAYQRVGLSGHWYF